MARLKINGNVKIGCIYECNFGLYKEKGTSTGTTKDRNLADINNLNYRIPNELIKRRPVIVVSKHRGLCIVVPISTTKETHKKETKVPENQGIHVKLSPNDFPVGSHQYDNQVDMWAKCNLVTCIESGRLNDLFAGVDENNNKIFLDAFKIPEDTLQKIREGIVKSIGFDGLLKNSKEVLKNDQ